MASELSTQYFYLLTPERIDEAFRQAGLNVLPSFRWMNSLENRVIGVEDEEGERWVGKFYRPGRWSMEALQEEHRFMEELFEADVPVRPPLSLENGGTVGEVEGILFSIFPHQFGRMPDEITLEYAQILGGLVANIHKVGEKSGLSHRPQIGPRTWGLESLGQLEAEDVVPRHIWPRYAECVMTLVDKLEGLFESFDTLRVHGDLHRGNILWESQGPSFVDFDDLTTGPAVQDLWMLLPGRDEEDWILKEAFLRSYEGVREFNREELELVEPLRALKFVRHAAWVARRRQDPAFVRVFPEIESSTYWNREYEDLKSQMRLL